MGEDADGALTLSCENASCEHLHRKPALAPSALGVLRAGINSLNVLQTMVTRMRALRRGTGHGRGSWRRLGLPLRSSTAHPDVVRGRHGKGVDVAGQRRRTSPRLSTSSPPAYCEIQHALVRARATDRASRTRRCRRPGRAHRRQERARTTCGWRHLRHAKTAGFHAYSTPSFELFDEHGLDALAGFGLKLLEDSAKGDFKLPDEPFMLAQQALGCLRAGEGEAPAAAREYRRRVRRGRDHERACGSPYPEARRRGAALPSHTVSQGT